MPTNTEVFQVYNENKISRRLKYFFYVLHFILGLDLGYFKGTTCKNKTLIYTYSLVHSICVCINVVTFLYFENVEYVVCFWISTMLFQHIFNTTVLSYSDVSSSFYTLQNSLIVLDSRLSITNQIKTDDYIILFCFSSAVYRSIVTYLFCTFYNDECVNSVVGASISHFQLLANDSLLILCFFIFFNVYLRLRVFIRFVKYNECSVVRCLEIYQSIVDMVDQIKKLFDVLYAVALVVATPNLILTTYMGITKFKRHSESESYIEDNIVRVLYCIQDFGLLFAPAISAGLLTSGVKDLKETLHDRLLAERNEEHARTIEVFTSFVEARSLTLTVFEVVRLDWSLPVLVVNLCISYQIVVVQLTHLY